MNSKRIFFMNGKFIPEKEAVVPVTTHALHYGTGNYEGIRAYYSADDNCLYVFRLEDHFKRMENSTKIMHIKLPGTPKNLSGIAVELLKKNFSETDIYIRPLAFKSDPAIGNFNLAKVSDSFIMYCVPLGRHYQKDEGLKANISSWTRVSNKSIPPRGKITGSYANTCLAKTESAQSGFDEALLLDNNGYVVEGSAENLFIVKDGKLVTPPESADILVGVTRNSIIEIAKKELGIDVEERNISKNDLITSDEVFLCGTGSEIAGIVEIDGKIIGSGEVGEVTGKVKSLYYDIVHGKNEKYSHWLTKVEKVKE
jgi:branched-chain amino acid aminotransferase